jgi:UDP-N-acetylmuramate--alanine ligase
MEKIHLIGIGGTGLSAIAKVLLEQGYLVSGSDQVYSELAEAVDQAGARVYTGHAADQVRGADLVIRSSAVPEDNVEVLTARDNNIPVVTRKEFLSRLMSDQQVIAVAGSHGKTTTTSMLVWIMSELDQNPSFIVGGVVSGLHTNAAAGAGQYFVIEADEYDYMFLGLEPDLEVITNIEHDHPDMFPTEQDFRQAFLDFSGQLKEDGQLILCGDDPGTRQLAEDFLGSQQVVSYGIKGQSLDYRAESVQVNARGGMDFVLVWKDPQGGRSCPVSLQVSGKHNVLNAAAALAVIDRLGLSVEKGAAALSAFQGSGRRFEVIGTYDRVTLVDDYGHHPTEIAATLEAARSRFPDSRIWAVWEPHTYSRIAALSSAFAGAFKDADRVLVTKVYPAREEKPEDFSIEEVVSGIESVPAEYFQAFDDLVLHLVEHLGPGDVVIVLSAGDAVEINHRLAESLGKQTQVEKKVKS